MSRSHREQPPSSPSSAQNVLDLPSPVLVTEPAHLRQVLRELEQEPVVAVDTESDSLYAYFYKVCLIQLSCPEVDYLVDPLALPDVAGLGRLMSNAAVQKVMHAAENDVIALKRDYSFSFANIFDTLWAARILGWPNRNLAAILKARFGVQMNKRTQRTNWGHRPLTAEQLAYARLDSRYLLPLREMQVAELRARGRLDEALEAFARIPQVHWEEKPFDPDGFWRIKGARDLSPRALAILRELFFWREERARELDRPLFKVVGDRTLLRLAEERPADGHALRQVPGMSRSQVGWHGHGILAAIERGQHAPVPRPPARSNSGRGGGFDKAAQERFERLRSWRNARADQRGVDPDVVLSNEELRSIAILNPRTPEALEQVEALGPWRRQAYGSELLGLLAPRKKPLE